MPIAGDDDRLLALGQRKQMVVAGIGGTGRRRRRVLGLDGGAQEEHHESARILRRHVGSQPRVTESTLELSQQVFGDDELEVATQPARDDLRRRPAGRKESRDQNVDVEDGSHSGPAGPGLVLSLDRERRRFFLRELVSTP